MGVKLNEKLKCNIKTAELDEYISRLDFDWWFDKKDLWLCKAVGLEYFKKISGIGYKIENNMMIKSNINPKIKLWKIRRYLIIDLKKYQ